MVKATYGKVVRAEPVSALYGDDVTAPRVHHVGHFPALEDQLCGFTTMGYLGEGSPDRADAVVWALTELMLFASIVTLTPPIVVTQPLAIHGTYEEGM